ncbi:MAG: arsenic transporter [Microbacterium sp.]|uniref:SLC13 family permease n=1 Tax=unclassified Microbacterium TaxID=2609290 RepID=UPI0011157275|nr:MULTISPECIES: SLC13 family permease [unclassified Microbacterium]MBQ9917143.1 arsenic transporter [Microbacterium sp.]MXS73369.1 arsenic transporter [Microbacterium sp. TL13]
MTLAIIGGVLWILGIIALLVGIFPADQALAVADRVWPILLFVVAVTVVAELASKAGLFDVVAARLARIARGRTAWLWVLVVALATVATAFLSLDTTAVLLTPVVVAMAVARKLDPLPFAFVTVVLANTASLFLPVSNLTNLLASDALGGHDPVAFLALLGPSALIAVAVSVVVLTVVFLRKLPKTYPDAASPAVADPVLLRVSAVVTVALLPLLVIGLDPWMPALAAAVVLIVTFALRAPRALGIRLVPWSLLVFAGGLFLAVGALEAVGIGRVTSVLAGSGDDLVSLWQLAGVGALAANGINNLPAYLAMESVAGSPVRLAALLIGVNAGPIVTPWASLATLLWHDRLVAAGVEVRWSRFILLGAVIAPLILVLAVLPLAL